MLSNANYVAAAFAVVWGGLFIYIFALMKRARTTSRDIEKLKEELSSNK